MHDLYEGIVPYHLKILLCHCVQQKYSTIDKVNERITLYDFIGDQPSMIDPKLASSRAMNIRQSAAQMISPTILEWHDTWQWWALACVLDASQDLCYSHHTIEYLRVLVEGYLFNFTQLNPNEDLKPKHHYMVHYASQIERLGPLIVSWNMREGAKLGFVKRFHAWVISRTYAKQHSV